LEAGQQHTELKSAEEPEPLVEIPRQRPGSEQLVPRVEQRHDERVSERRVEQQRQRQQQPKEGQQARPMATLAFHLHQNPLEYEVEKGAAPAAAGRVADRHFVQNAGDQEDSEQGASGPKLSYKPRQKENTIHLHECEVPPPRPELAKAATRQRAVEQGIDVPAREPNQRR